MHMHDHNHGDHKPSVNKFLTNLHVDMPLYKKVWLIFRNNMKKIITFNNCCGHPGEPGC